MQDIKNKTSFISYVSAFFKILHYLVLKFNPNTYSIGTFFFFFFFFLQYCTVFDQFLPVFHFGKLFHLLKNDINSPLIHRKTPAFSQLVLGQGSSE